MFLLSGVLCLFVVLFAALSRHLNVPLIIIALLIGILFGSDVTGLIYFDNALLAQQVANVALVFVLFAGGYGTKRSDLQPILKPTMLLATLGVLVTAGATALLFGWISGWAFQSALLLAAIISSTDAAAVFSILRNRKIDSPVAAMTEIESAANDPMAIVSTTFVIQLVTSGSMNTNQTLLQFFWQLGGGILFGFAIGHAGVFLFRKIRELEVGYFYIFLLGVILVAFGLADLARASGMLSAFFAGYVFGNSPLPYKKGISSFSGTLSFLSNVVLFILLGLLVFPRQFAEVWHLGVILFLIVTFVARPISVWLFTLGTGLQWREKVFLGWSGIRGAVPIVLATYPAAAGLDPEHKIFNIVFFAVALSIVLQGTTIGWLADFFKLSAPIRGKARQAMELVSVHETNYELVEIAIDAEVYAGGCRIADLALGSGVTITMVSRGDQLIAPAGDTVLLPGDTISLLVENHRAEEQSLRILHKFQRRDLATG